MGEPPKQGVGWAWGLVGVLASWLAVMAGGTALGTAAICLFVNPAFWPMILVWAVAAGASWALACWCFSRAERTPLRPAAPISLTPVGDRPPPERSPTLRFGPSAR